LLGDADRARAIYQLAIQQTTLDMPEVLWKAYIDFEIQQEEYENARRLYHRLLQRTHHVKVSPSDSQKFLPICNASGMSLISGLDQFRTVRTVGHGKRGEKLCRSGYFQASQSRTSRQCREGRTTDVAGGLEEV